MRVLGLLSIILFCSFSLIHAQYNYGCDGERYITKVTEDVGLTSVLYGTNVEPDGDVVDLKMDIYYPQNDNVDARPAIVLAHGGSFIGGTRQELIGTCLRLADHGYVAATIDYRLLNLLGGIPDSISAMDIAVKAAHDMKGAIRYLKHSAIEDGNPYNIDPDMMFSGGYSAGAITALIASALDLEEINEAFLLEILENNNGIQGNTGDSTHLVYGSDVRGILNFSGAVYDLNWLDAEDPLIVSMHGDDDETVPYDHNFVNVFGFPIVKLHGSGSMHNFMDENSIPAYLYTVEGGGHTDIYFDNSYSDQFQEFRQNADTLFANIICDGIVDVLTTPALNISFSPNPVKNILQFTGISPTADVYFYNSQGQNLLQSRSDANGNIDVSSLISGVYYFSLQQDGKTFTDKFVKL